MMEFKDKVAVVTGGSSGIGYGISESLAKKGAKVYLVARNKEKLEEAKQRISFNGGNVEIRPASITDLDSMKEIVDGVYDTEKRLDIFVNNAGTYKPLGIGSDSSEIREMIELNTLAPLFISQYLAQKFGKIQNNDLKILTVASQATLKFFPDKGGLGYGTAKKSLVDGLLELENQLVVEGIKNITLYRIYPGTVGTEGVMDLVKKGLLQNPTSLDSVVDTAVDLLKGDTPTRDAFIGYVPGEGIKRVYYNIDLMNYSPFGEGTTEIIDSEFNPKKDL